MNKVTPSGCSTISWKRRCFTPRRFRTPQWSTSPARAWTADQFRRVRGWWPALHGLQRRFVLQLLEGVSLYVDCADQAEVDEYWDKLVKAGATPTACGWIRTRLASRGKLCRGDSPS